MPGAGLAIDMEKIVARGILLAVRRPRRGRGRADGRNFPRSRSVEPDNGAAMIVAMEQKLGALCRGTFNRSADQRGIAGEIADGRIKLGEREAHADSLLRLGRPPRRLGESAGHGSVESDGAVHAGGLRRLGHLL